MLSAIPEWIDDMQIYIPNYDIPPIQYFQGIDLPDVLETNEGLARMKLITTSDSMISQKTILKNKHWIKMQDFQHYADCSLVALSTIDMCNMSLLSIHSTYITPP